MSEQPKDLLMQTLDDPKAALKLLNGALLEASMASRESEALKERVAELERTLVESEREGRDLRHQGAKLVVEQLAKALAAERWAARWKRAAKNRDGVSRRCAALERELAATVQACRTDAALKIAEATQELRAENERLTKEIAEDTLRWNIRDRCQAELAQLKDSLRAVRVQLEQRGVECRAAEAQIERLKGALTRLGSAVAMGSREDIAEANRAARSALALTPAAGETQDEADAKLTARVDALRAEEADSAYFTPDEPTPPARDEATVPASIAREAELAFQALLAFLVTTRGQPSGYSGLEMAIRLRATEALSALRDALEGKP